MASQITCSNKRVLPPGDSTAAKRPKLAPADADKAQFAHRRVTASSRRSTRSSPPAENNPGTVRSLITRSLSNWLRRDSMHSALAGDAGTINNFFDRGGNPEARDHQGNTLLHLLARYQGSNDKSAHQAHSACEQLLRRYSSKQLRQMMCTTNSQGQTPWHLLVQHSEQQDGKQHLRSQELSPAARTILVELLQAGASPLVTPAIGERAALAAVPVLVLLPHIYRDRQLISALLGQNLYLGIRENHQPYGQYLPRCPNLLCAAISLRDPELLEQLLSCGAKPHQEYAPGQWLITLFPEWYACKEWRECADVLYRQAVFHHGNNFDTNLEKTLGLLDALHAVNSDFANRQTRLDIEAALVCLLQLCPNPAQEPVLDRPLGQTRFRPLNQSLLQLLYSKAPHLWQALLLNPQLREPLQHWQQSAQQINR